MAGRKQRELPRELARGRDRLAAWRRTKKPKSRIPGRLWESAVRHGLHRTARTLKLDFYSLKKRVEVNQARAEGCRERNVSAFLELPPTLTPIQECVIELENSVGTDTVGRLMKSNESNSLTDTREEGNHEMDLIACIAVSRRCNGISS